MQEALHGFENLPGFAFLVIFGSFGPYQGTFWGLFFTFWGFLKQIQAYDRRLEPVDWLKCMSLAGVLRMTLQQSRKAGVETQQRLFLESMRSQEFYKTRGFVKPGDFLLQ